MDITDLIVNFTSSLIILILTFIAFYFPLKIYLNLLKNKEAALGLIFTKLDKSIMAFKIYAIAVLIFAIGRSVDVFNLIPSSYTIDNLVTIIYLTTDILLIYSFYKLWVITRIDKGINNELNLNK
jgi:hypothetical protein